MYRGQSVGIDADAISTGSDSNFCDLEKDEEDLDGLERSSPLKYRASLAADAEVDERQWVLLDCYFGVPLFDADVNRSVCRRIAKHGLCNQARCVVALRVFVQ